MSWEPDGVLHLHAVHGGGADRGLHPLQLLQLPVAAVPAVRQAEPRHVRIQVQHARGSQGERQDRQVRVYLSTISNYIYLCIYLDIYREVLGDLYDIYYDNRDLRLLLELLATSSGVAPAIAIMTLFDKVRGKTLTNHLNKFTIFCLQNFREAMKPSIRYVIASREQGLAEVQFQVDLCRL